jgi:holo-ACP synthase/triphosphoribosyl-dephospho-CoA synthase
MQILTEILKAKEDRQIIRKGFSKLGYATISFNLNIPGYPKSDNSIRAASLIIKQELQNYLIASRIAVISEKIKIQHDEAGDICFFPIQDDKYDLRSIKDDLESFEENHPLGRLLDVDLFDNKINPISSGKKKACFLCADKSAIECMREERHSYEELKSHIANQIEIYLESERKDDICKRLSAIATQAILMEVSLPGKPGLVCPNSQGSHTDMNYLTFINSTSAINPYFERIAELGYDWNGVRNKQILQKLRAIGLEMEQAMLQATNGINTQKGIIFLIGYSLFAAAYVLKPEKIFDVGSFKAVLKLLNKELVSKELENGWNKNSSHGEKCFNKFGKEFAGGIRQEIEEGFPTVFEVSLPYMQELFPNGIDINEQKTVQKKLLKVLITIMSVNNDTNILHRSNTDALDELKAIATQVIRSTEEITNNGLYNELLNYCKTKNISPGGSADLLAITIFIYQLINKFKR